MDPNTRLMLFALAIAVVSGLALAGAAAVLLQKLGRRHLARWERRASWIFLCLGLLGAAAFAWGVLVEPNQLGVTHERIETDRLPAGELLRIVHLSDLHLDGSSAPFDRIPAMVNALKPDLVVFTGDALNEASAAPRFRELIESLEARLGRFAVRGNHDVRYWGDIDLFGGGVAHELTGAAPLLTAGGEVALCGANFGVTGQLEDCIRDAPKGAFVLVAYHTPDLIEDLAPLSPDLYLAGHTHGGQVRLPLYGAVITLSRFDKKYEMGRYLVGETVLSVSRGVGVEGGNAPRVRFLAPPEIALLELVGTERVPRDRP